MGTIEKANTNTEKAQVHRQIKSITTGEIRLCRSEQRCRQLLSAGHKHQKENHNPRELYQQRASGLDRSGGFPHDQPM